MNVVRTSWDCAERYSAVSADMGAYAEGRGTLSLVPMTNGQSGAFSRITCPTNVSKMLEHDIYSALLDGKYLPRIIVCLPRRKELV